MRKSDDEHLAALIERVARLLHADSHNQGLLPVHWEVLRYLQRANRFSCTPAAVTAYLGLTKGTVSQTLNTLEMRGLIKKRVNTKDRRARRLSLTSKSARLLKQDPLGGFSAALCAMSPATKAHMVTGLKELLARKLEANHRQPFGQCRDCVYFSADHENGKPHFCELLEETLSEGDSETICYEQTERTQLRKA